MSAEDLNTQRPSVLEVVRRRRFVVMVTFGILAIVALTFCVLYPFRYGALSHVLLVNDVNGRDPAATGVDMPTIITGSTLLFQVKQELNLSYSVNDLRKRVQARVLPKSSLMTIAYEDHNPTLAMKIDNALARTFAKLYSNLAGSRYDEVVHRLQGDVDAARNRVQILDRKLEAASSGSSYVGSQASLDATAAHLGDLEESHGVLLGQYAVDESNLRADLGAPGKLAKVIRYEILKNNPAYFEAQIAISKDLAQYTTTRAGTLSGYPGMAGFQDKITREDRALDALRTAALNGRDAYSPSQAGQIVKVSSDLSNVRGDRIKLAAFEDQIKALKEGLSNPPGSVSSMGALRAERDAAEAQLQALSLSLSSAQTSSAQSASLGQALIVDLATDARPTILRPALLLPLGLIAALLLAIGAAYLAELISPRLLGPSDVEAVYARPNLATLRSR